MWGQHSAYQEDSGDCATWVYPNQLHQTLAPKIDPKSLGRRGTEIGPLDAYRKVGAHDKTS